MFLLIILTPPCIYRKNDTGITCSGGASASMFLLYDSLLCSCSCELCSALRLPVCKPRNPKFLHCTSQPVYLCLCFPYQCAPIPPHDSSIWPNMDLAHKNVSWGGDPRHRLSSDALPKSSNNQQKAAALVLTLNIVFVQASAEEIGNCCRGHGGNFMFRSCFVRDCHH